MVRRAKDNRKLSPSPTPEFHLPVRNLTNVNAKNYLVKVRGLDERLVALFSTDRDIYEEAKHHNVLLLG